MLPTPQRYSSSCSFEGYPLLLLVYPSEDSPESPSPSGLLLPKMIMVDDEIGNYDINDSNGLIKRGCMLVLVNKRMLVEFVFDDDFSDGLIVDFGL